MDDATKEAIEQLKERVFRLEQNIDDPRYMSRVLRRICTKCEGSGWINAPGGGYPCSSCGGFGATE